MGLGLELLHFVELFCCYSCDVRIKTQNLIALSVNVLIFAIRLILRICDFFCQIAKY